MKKEDYYKIVGMLKTKGYVKVGVDYITKEMADEIEKDEEKLLKENNIKLTRFSSFKILTDENAFYNKGAVINEEIDILVNLKIKTIPQILKIFDI